MVSGIVYVFIGFIVRDWSRATDFTNYGGGYWGLDNYRPFSWKVSTCVRMIPVKSFLYQTKHSKVMIKTPNAPNMSIIG